METQDTPFHTRVEGSSVGPGSPHRSWDTQAMQRDREPRTSCVWHSHRELSTSTSSHSGALGSLRLHLKPCDLPCTFQAPGRRRVFPRSPSLKAGARDLNQPVLHFLSDCLLCPPSPAAYSEKARKASLSTLLALCGAPFARSCTVVSAWLLRHCVYYRTSGTEDIFTRYPNSLTRCPSSILQSRLGTRLGTRLGQKSSVKGRWDSSPLGTAQGDPSHSPGLGVAPSLTVFSLLLYLVPQRRREQQAH